VQQQQERRVMRNEIPQQRQANQPAQQPRRFENRGNDNNRPQESRGNGGRGRFERRDG
jgi:hypothetical protein